MAVLLLGTALGASSVRAQQSPPVAAVPAAPSVVGRDVIGVEPGTPRHRPEITVPNSLESKIDPALLTRDVEFRHIAIDGASAFTAQQILPLFAPILNRRVKFSEVVAAVRAAALAPRGAHGAAAAPAAIVFPHGATAAYDIVVIGASTGGPQAVSLLIAALPASFPVPVAVVLHMPPGYTASYADRIDGESAPSWNEGSDDADKKHGEDDASEDYRILRRGLIHDEG